MANLTRRMEKQEDPTFKKYRGYIANVVEVADDDHNSISVDDQFEKKIIVTTYFSKTT